MAIIPRSVVEKNKLQLGPVDPDEPDYEGMTGMKLTEVKQTGMFIMVLRAIVCEEEGDEILVDLDMLIQWSIIPRSFLLPVDPKERLRNVRVAADIPKKMVDIKERSTSSIIIVKYLLQTRWYKDDKFSIN